MTSTLDNQQYLNKILNFLKKYPWLYDYANVDILNTKYFSMIPQIWVDIYSSLQSKITEKDFQIIEEDINNAEFKGFLSEIKNLNVPFDSYDFNCSITDSKLCNRVKNKKKCHEIECLAKVVHDVCQKQDIEVIIDIGCGLGYISFLLYENFNYKILAIEGNADFVDSACEYQKKKCPNSLKHIKIIHHFITEKSLDVLEKLLVENFKEELEMKPKVCIVGLHACADLSVTVLDVFSQLNFSGCLVIMPCCYHRMSQNKNGEFEKFPASKTLKNIVLLNEAKEILRVPFLRLSCQFTAKKYESFSKNEILKQSEMWMLRAILQNIAAEENYEVHRLKRKSGKISYTKDSNVIEDFMNKLNTSYKLVSKCDNKKEMDQTFLEEKIRYKWKKFEDKCNVFQFLSVFQTKIQAICEKVVLLDKVEFLREKGLDCFCYKVVDERISPRCHALLSFKNE